MLGSGDGPVNSSFVPFVSNTLIHTPPGRLFQEALREVRTEKLKLTVCRNLVAFVWHPSKHSKIPRSWLLRSVCVRGDPRTSFLPDLLEHTALEQKTSHDRSPASEGQARTTQIEKTPFSAVRTSTTSCQAFPLGKAAPNTIARS
jgi:hypothetical protein